MGEDRYAFVDSGIVADFLEQARTLDCRVWECEFRTKATVILRWLDGLGLTRREGRKRVLVCGVDEAVERVRGEHLEIIRKPRGKRVTNVRGDVGKRFRVVWDPSEYFSPGAEWPALTVWGKEGKEPPLRGEFADGTRLRLYDGREAVADFVLCERGFVQLEVCGG